LSLTGQQQACDNANKTSGHYFQKRVCGKIQCFAWQCSALLVGFVSCQKCLQPDSRQWVKCTVSVCSSPRSFIDSFIDERDDDGTRRWSSGVSRLRI